MPEKFDSADSRTDRSDFLEMAKYLEIDDFRFEDVQESGKNTFFLQIPGESDKQNGIPLLIANGSKPGKTLAVFAGIHGDELEGVQAIQDVFRQINTDEMAGRFIAVSAANLPAVRVVKRNSPIDSLNLARTFPGDKTGSITEKIAYYLSELIIPQADFFLDLHSSGVAYLMPLMVGYDASQTEAGIVSKEAAFLFGTPVVWGHGEVSPGRSISSAIEKNVPWLYVESPNGGRVSTTDLPFYINGIINLLKYLNIIVGEIPKSSPSYRLIGAGDVDQTQTFTNPGFFVAEVKLLDYVEKGQKIGEVRNVFGETIDEIFTQRSGYIANLRAMPIVSAGDTAFLVTDAEQYNAHND